MCAKFLRDRTCTYTMHVTQYFLNFVKNNKATNRRTATPAPPVTTPASSNVNPVPPATPGLAPVVGTAANRGPSGLPSPNSSLVRLRRNAPPTLVQVPVQLRSTVHTLNLDINEILPRSPKPRMTARLAVPRVFPAELAEIKAQLDSERTEPLAERDNTIHREAVTQFIENATDEQWDALRTYIQTNANNRDLGDTNRLA